MTSMTQWAPVDSRYRYRWLVFVAMLAGEIMDVLDASILNVAGPALERAFAASGAQLQWAIGIYSLGMGAALIVGGCLGDVFGRRRMLLVALWSFALTSLACAAAVNIEMLIIGRLLQGISGALLLPQGFALLKHVFDRDELGKALSIFAPLLGASAVAGPVVGGLLINLDVFGLGWRAAIGINVPIALATLAIAYRCVPLTPGLYAPRDIDCLGALWVAVGSAALVLPLIEEQQADWPTWKTLSLAISALAFLLFYRQQRRRSQHGLRPLIPASLLANRQVSAGMVCMAFFFSMFIGLQLVFTLFLQFGNGYSAMAAGVAALPLTAGTFVGAGLAGGGLLKRMGRGVLQLGAVVQVITALGLWGLMGADVLSIEEVAYVLFFTGLGGGLIIASIISVVISAATSEEIGACSGLLASVQAISAVVGIALCAGLFFPALQQGLAGNGFRANLLVQTVVMLCFLTFTFLLPRHLSDEASAEA